MTPHVLIDPDGGDPGEPGRIVDQHPLALGDDRLVGGMPGHSQPGSDAADGEVVHDHTGQRPAHPATGDLRPRRRGLRRVLPPRPTAGNTPVPADPDHQGRGPVPERLVRQPADHRVSGHALGPALPAPRVRLQDPALDHRTIRLNPLSDGLEAELVETAERGQVRANEGSVIHVEVLRMGSVRTSILGGPRPLSSDRRAQPDYTLSREEPRNAPATCSGRSPRAT